MISFKDILKHLPFIGQKSVGIALGSGAARGLAHLGILDVLMEAGVEIEFVSGTSIGAFVGAFFCAGKIDELVRFAKNLTSWESLKFADFMIPKNGLIEGKKIEKFMRDHLGDRRIQDLDIPFACVAADYYTGAEVILNKGDLVDAVRASISIPGIFKPVPVNGLLLVDGGVVNPVPVEVVRGLGADYIIAVDISPSIANMTISKDVDNFRQEDMAALSKFRSDGRNLEHSPNIFEVIMGSISIMEALVNTMRLKSEKPDIIIKPDVFDLGLFEFYKYKLGVSRGEEAAKGVLNKIDRFVKRRERALIKAS
ncbi:MAG: patatin-like phospholipase family protein [Deltaproteobacteria bacterium]|uniref:Patatin-like phospholipase family protein n=1 Tax=Candidatus Zymogenus saltonus TaxID=2844893 RepID=A0A9D8PMM5_9DELT|nr:patatin-like phospholipase family protein [Candidatus Zymogenus saltonus]